MKNLLPVILAISCFSANGQSKVLRCGRIIRDFDNATYSDSLYSSFYNPVLVSTADIPFDQLDISADSAEIIKERYPPFYVKVNGNPHKIFIKIYAFKKLIDSISFVVVEDLPHLPIKLCGEILLMDSYPGFPLKLSCVKVEETEAHRPIISPKIKFEVLSFVACIESNGKIFYEEHICGDQFTETFKTKYQQCRGGDKLLIKSITARDEANGNIYTKLNQYSVTLN